MALSNSPFTRPKRELNSNMNVVPYIDVMLVLLVIFMVTAPMITAGLTVDLPKAPSSPLAASKHPPATVTVLPDHKLYVSFNGGKAEPITQDELQTRLTDAQSNDPNFAVVIRGDRRVPYGDVATLMATLQASGLAQVGLMTQPVDSPEQ